MSYFPRIPSKTHVGSVTVLGMIDVISSDGNIEVGLNVALCIPVRKMSS